MSPIHQLLNGLPEETYVLRLLISVMKEQAGFLNCSDNDQLELECLCCPRKQLGFEDAACYSETVLDVDMRQFNMFYEHIEIGGDCTYHFILHTLQINFCEWS